MVCSETQDTHVQIYLCCHKNQKSKSPSSLVESLFDVNTFSGTKYEFSDTRGGGGGEPIYLKRYTQMTDLEILDVPTDLKRYILTNFDFLIVLKITLCQSRISLEI